MGGFGQLVTGPPGSGKTTYCNAVQQFVGRYGIPVSVVNLDPANDQPSYECAVDIRDLITLDEIQREAGLGPNGGLVFALEFLRDDLAWLDERLAPLLKDQHYLLFDCPGQVELFSLHSALQDVVTHLTRGAPGLSLATVHLVDALLCADPSKYVSAILLSLSSMLHVELPHVNVLSKVDLLKTQQHAEGFDLEYFLEARDLGHLISAMDSSALLPERFRRMAGEICETVEDFGLMGFEALDVSDPRSLSKLLRVVHAANGFAYAQPDAPWEAGAGEDWAAHEEAEARARLAAMGLNMPPEPGSVEGREVASDGGTSIGDAVAEPAKGAAPGARKAGKGMRKGFLL
ncbi:unnamed protein product [Pedinophyceae sp. YPF-701]|nr:unnamed protein product [Pedinophyceae sp. YPF-701]